MLSYEAFMAGTSLQMLLNNKNMTQEFWEPPQDNLQLFTPLRFSRLIKLLFLQYDIAFGVSKATFYTDIISPWLRWRGGHLMAEINPTKVNPTSGPVKALRCRAHGNNRASMNSNWLRSILYLRAISTNVDNDRVPIVPTFLTYVVSLSV